MFHRNLIRLLTAERRLSVRRIALQKGSYPTILFGRRRARRWGFMGVFSVRSRIAPSPIGRDPPPYFRRAVGGGPPIRECELVAATMAIFVWCQRGRLNVALWADNQNVLIWVDRVRSHSPAANQILRSINKFFLRNKVDVSPAYVRSGSNLFPDGLTRWTPGEVELWVNSEGMTQIDATAQLWAAMELSYDLSPDAERPPNTFALLGHILHFCRSYNYRVCEWRPFHYSVASVLGNWGVPVFSDQILDRDLHDLLARRSPHPLPVIWGDDIFFVDMVAYHLVSNPRLSSHGFLHVNPMRGHDFPPFCLRDVEE